MTDAPIELPTFCTFSDTKKNYAPLHSDRLSYSASFLLFGGDVCRHVAAVLDGSLPFVGLGVANDYHNLMSAASWMGRERGRPDLPIEILMKPTSGITCSPSLALAKVTRTASGIPKASTSEWISTPHLCNHIQPHLLPLCQGEKEPSTLAAYQLISPCHWASESIPCFRRSRVPFSKS